MSIPEFRERRHDAEQKLGPNATQEAIAKKIGLHVTTIRLYRKRDEVYEKLKQELGREPTEAEVDAVVLQHRQKRRSTRKK